MCPHDIKMEANSNDFFDTIMRILNVRYVNAQQVELDHKMEERDLDMALHDDDEVDMDVDARDPTAHRYNQTPTSLSWAPPLLPR